MVVCEVLLIDPLIIVSKVRLLCFIRFRISFGSYFENSESST